MTGSFLSPDATAEEKLQNRLKSAPPARRDDDKVSTRRLTVLLVGLMVERLDESGAAHDSQSVSQSGSEPCVV